MKHNYKSIKEFEPEAEKQIAWVCQPCGYTANYLTCLLKYGKRPHKPAYDISTWHRGFCDVCGSPSSLVTEPRDFFYPDFSLINKVAEFLKILPQETEQ